jgi:shikimate kinase
MDELPKIFLVGYMGAGKTTIGKCLAEKLKLSFIDLDIFIENRYHKTIGELFAGKGETCFREIERNLLQEVAQFENVIISTGGGTPCFFDNMATMNRAGITIYLQTGVDELVNRLKTGKEKRPLLKDKTDRELKEFVASNLEKREPFYKQATLIYPAGQLITEKDVEAMVNHVIENLKNK